MFIIVYFFCDILEADKYKTASRPFRTAWVRSANQITCLDNKEIQNKNKRPQWLLDEGGPFNTNDADEILQTDFPPKLSW